MFVLYLAEYFLYQVLQCDDAAGASELVHYYCYGAFLADERTQQFLGVHGLRYDGDVLDAMCPVVVARQPEHFRTVYESGYVVDVPLVDYYLRVATFYEQSLEPVHLCVFVHCHDLGARHYAVPDLDCAEVQSILEYLHLVLNLLFVVYIVYVALYQVVEVYLGECLASYVLLYLHACHSQESLAERTGELAYGP